MGTNYYYKADRSLLLDHCEPDEDGLIHVGKSSGGWCFALHVYPEANIRNLDDWRPLLASGNVTDEYGNYTCPDTILRIITERSWGPRPGHITPQFLIANHALPGPNGLLRQQVDGVHCIGHGDGTWDLVAGDFS